MIRFLLLLSCLTISISLLGGCMKNAKQVSSGQLVQLDHPMVGKIWDVKQASFISKEQLQFRLLESRYLLLGEIHDNISHHEHQAEIIGALVNAKATASIHFEMIDDEQYQRLALAKTKSVHELMDKLSGDKSGWQYQQMYRVVFDQVLQAGYEYWPANLSHETIRKIIKQGETQIPDDIKKLMADVPLSRDQSRELEQEVIDGHCNELPVKMVAPMILAQRARDATMALSLLQSNKDHRVLIAGSGHVRNDRGVPIYLAAKDSQAGIIAIGFTEVVANKHSIVDYTSEWDGELIPFDYVWFTPLFDRKDPCENLARHFKK